MARRIGLLGGTFNPVHIGHLRGALEVAEFMALDELRLIPSARPPHREAPQATAEQRLAMTRLATADNPHFTVSDMEMRRKGNSYTVDTLRFLKKLYGPSYILYFISGTDTIHDLYNWKDEGIALKVVEGDNSHPIAKGCILERPKVVYNKKTGKYVMWFHLELKGKGYGSAYAGVATATKPTGPFKFLKAGRVNPGKWPLNMDKKDQTAEFTKEMPDYVRIIRRDYPGGQMSRDMTIFVDDNGKAYHIYSSEGNITLHIAELTPDYTGHTGKYVRAFINRYMEAPAICKHKGKYYLIASGCTGWAPNAARSAVAKNIAGPWMELKNPCVGPKAGITFGGQSTFILPVQGKPGKFIFMADIWRPKNAIDGRYLWLPMKWEGDQIILEWKDEWTLDDL